MTCDDRRLHADDLVGSYVCEYTRFGDTSDPWGSGLPCVSMHLGSFVWGEGGVHGSRVDNWPSGQRQWALMCRIYQDNKYTPYNLYDNLCFRCDKVTDTDPI